MVKVGLVPVNVVITLGRHAELVEALAGGGRTLSSHTAGARDAILILGAAHMHPRTRVIAHAIYAQETRVSV